MKAQSKLIYSVAAVLIAVPAFAQEDLTFSGKTVGVSDGDTIKVMHNGAEEKIRLNGIDCPETKQAFGNKAKKKTAALCFKKIVIVTPHGKDRYGRTIGDVVLPNGRSLNKELVKSGFAWWYRKYAPDNSELKALEEEARKHKRGLWRDLRAVPPWEFRHPTDQGNG